MPSTLLVLWTIPPTLRTFPPNRPKWVHFCRALPHSAKKSPFPGIKKAGRGRTLSGQMTLFFHFFPSEGVFLSIQPYILTFYQPKHAKITTQASYQNLSGYMANLANYDTEDDAHCRAQSRVHLHPGAYRAITVQMHRRSKGPDARCFSATKKKGRLVKPPAAMHTFHIFLDL